MSTKLRVGIVGAGFIATRGHLPAYQRHPQAEVVALCDVNGDRARAVAEEFGVPHVFSDYRQMLQAARLDVVTVCVPNALHAPVTIAALELGAHVLCEKPMAITVADAEAMAAAAERAGRNLTIGFHNRFRPQSQTLKGFVDQGLLGEIYYARVSMLRRSGIPGYGSWFTNKELAGGGGLIDSGVHGLDLALWIMGHPRPVAVVGVTFSEFGPRRKGLGGWGSDIYEGQRRFDVDDLAAAMIRFENGAALAIEASWAGYSSSGERLRFFGRDGGAEIDMSYRDVERPLRLFTDLHENPVEIIPSVDRPSVPAHGRQIEDFVDSIVHDRQPLTTPEQGVLITRIIEGIYRSAETGREVVFG